MRLLLALLHFMLSPWRGTQEWGRMERMPTGNYERYCYKNDGSYVHQVIYDGVIVGETQIHAPD